MGMICVCVLRVLRVLRVLVLRVLRVLGVLRERERVCVCVTYRRCRRGSSQPAPRSRSAR